MEEKDSVPSGGPDRGEEELVMHPPEAVENPAPENIAEVGMHMECVKEPDSEDESDMEGRAKFREALLSGISQAERMPFKPAAPPPRRTWVSATPFDWQTYDPSQGKDIKKGDAQGSQRLPENRDVPPGQEHHLAPRLHLFEESRARFAQTRALLEAARARPARQDWSLDTVRQALRDHAEDELRRADPADPGAARAWQGVLRRCKEEERERQVDAELDGARVEAVRQSLREQIEARRARSQEMGAASVREGVREEVNPVLFRAQPTLQGNQGGLPEGDQAADGSTPEVPATRAETEMKGVWDNLVGDMLQRPQAAGEGGSTLLGEGGRRRPPVCNKVEDNRSARARHHALREAEAKLDTDFIDFGGASKELDGGPGSAFFEKGRLGGVSLGGGLRMQAAGDEGEPEHDDSSDDESFGKRRRPLKWNAKGHGESEDKSAGGSASGDNAASEPGLGLESYFGQGLRSSASPGTALGLEGGLSMGGPLSAAGDPGFSNLELDLIEDGEGSLEPMRALDAWRESDPPLGGGSAVPAAPPASFLDRPNAPRLVFGNLEPWVNYAPQAPLSPPLSLEAPNASGDLFEDVDAFAQDAGAEPSEAADAWMTSAEPRQRPRRPPPVIRDLEDLRKFSKMEAERQTRGKASDGERPMLGGKPPLKKRVRKLVDFGKGLTSASGSLLSKPAKRLIASLPKGAPSTPGERMSLDGRLVRPASEPQAPAEGYFGVEAADSELPLFDLTQDLLYQVFSHLDAPSLCSVAQVCRQWGAMSAHEDFWHTLDFGRKELREEEIVDVCKKFPKASTVLLSGSTKLVESLVRNALGRLRCLTSLFIKDVHTTLPSADAFFRGLTEHCPELRGLAVTETSLTSPAVVISHPQLETLTLDRSHSHTLKLSCPALKTLSLQRAVVTSFTLECPLLETVDVSACHKLNDSMLRSALATCPNLGSLDVSNCSLVTDETLRVVATTCAKLERLDTSHCPLLTFANMRFPELLKLKAVGCEAVAAACVNMLAYSYKLECLTLDYCWALDTLTLELYHLHSLSLFNCRKLSEVRLRTPRLSTFNLKSCDNLATVDLYSAEIRDLSLRGQPFLQHVRLRGPELTSLDLSDCDGLQQLEGATFLSEQACPKIALLVLDNCEGLSTLSLTSPSLSCLSLAGCSNLRSVDLACSSLTSLRTEGCNRLSHARLAPVALADVSLGTCPYLTSLNIQSKGMEGLDLRGCGALGQVELDCPNMTRLDTSYCSKLSSLSMAPLTAKCHSLSTLILAGATICSDGLLALSGLKALTKLDLSYTEIQSLEPVFVACHQLKVLLLSACKRLPDSALIPLHHKRSLPLLEELDVSYCNLSAQAAGDLFAFAPHLTRLSFNGCCKLDDSIWSRLAECPVEVPGQSQRLGAESPVEAPGQPQHLGRQQAPASLECSGESSGQSEGSTESPGRVTKRLRDVSLDDVRGEVRQRMLTLQEMMSWDNPLEKNDSKTKDDAATQPALVEKGVLQVKNEDSRKGKTASETEDNSRMDDETLQENSRASNAEPMAIEAPPPSSRLTSLSLVGCTRLSSVRIANSCAELLELNVSLSGNIRTVELACPKLAHLNLNQCASLGRAEIRCPNLRTLKLQGSKLNDAEVLKLLQGCSSLETLDVRGCIQLKAEETFKLLRELCPAMRRLHSDAL